MKTRSFLGLSLLGCLWVSSVAAEPLGRAGQLVLGAERLTGVQVEKLTIELGDQKETISSTNISLLGQGSALGVAGLSGPASMPRIGFDGFVTDGLSLGGSVMYWTQSGEDESEGVSSDNADLSTLHIAPRIGFALPLGDSVSFWPRAGISYTQYSISDEDTKISISAADATLEALFAATPVDHFAILFGPSLELPLTGSYHVDGGTGSDPDVSYFSYGLTAGIAGIF